MKIKLTQLIILFFLTSIIACGGKKVLISQTDIDAAKNSGKLEALYDKTSKLLKETSGTDRKKLISIRGQIVNLLFQDKAKLVDKVLSEKTRYGLVDKASLIHLSVEIEKTRPWELSSYDNLKQRINPEIEKTQNEINIVNQTLNQELLNIVERMKLLEKLSELGGVNSEEENNYQSELAKQIEALSANGRDAYNKRMYSIAADSANKGLAIDPGNIQFESLLSQSNAALFEQNFRSAMENGKPELAFQALKDIADKPLMLQIKKKMKASISLLANYFASNAQTKYRNNQLLSAYEEFKRGREIQRLLSSSSIGFVQEKQFLDLLIKKYDSQTDKTGARFALLKIIQEFDEKYPMLDERLKTEFDKIAERATTKIQVSEFKELASPQPVISSVGRRVSNKLEKILFEAN